jgi:hypothetical protein
MWQNIPKTKVIYTIFQIGFSFFFPLKTKFLWDLEYSSFTLWGHKDAKKKFSKKKILDHIIASFYSLPSSLGH